MVDKYDHSNENMLFSALKSHLDFETAVSFKTLMLTDAGLRAKGSGELSL